MSSRQKPPIRVGVVGANATRGWGTAAHLPALAELPEFELVAVATTRQQSADETARVFGVPLAFARAEDLVVHPDVDLVAVTVKVPGHAAVVRAALAAGKHVFSEWPLAVDAAEARSLAELANAAGVIHAVGLQGVHAPGARFVRDLIDEGRIGAVRSASLIAPGALGGTHISESMTWAADPAAGVSILTILGGHVLATLTQTLGESLAELSAVVANVGLATVIETEQTISFDTPGQVGLVGKLTGGALLSVTLHGGAPRATAGFTLEIVGTDGAFKVTPAEPRGGSLHIDDWKILFAGSGGDSEELAVPKSYRVIPDAVASGPPAAVAALYHEIARALAEGRQPYPSFDVAVHYHELLASVEAAAQSGERQEVR